MEIYGSEISCGVKEIVNLSLRGLKAFLKDTCKDDLDRVGNLGFDIDGRFEKGYTYAFSDACSNRNGRRVADYIRANRLGRLVSTRVTRNPNSGNRIKTWLWIYNGRVPQDLIAQAKKELKQEKLEPKVDPWRSMRLTSQTNDNW